MKLYCTLYRRTPNGLKIVGTDVGRLRIIDTGLEVTTSYSTASLKKRSYEMVQGVSSKQGQAGRLVELGLVHVGGLWGSNVTIYQPINVSF